MLESNRGYDMTRRRSEAMARWVLPCYKCYIVESQLLKALHTPLQIGSDPLRFDKLLCINDLHYINVAGAGWYFPPLASCEIKNQTSHAKADVFGKAPTVHALQR